MCKRWQQTNHWCCEGEKEEKKEEKEEEEEEVIDCGRYGYNGIKCICLHNYPVKW